MEYKPKSRRADDSLLRVNRKGPSVQRSLGPDLSFRPAPLLPNPHVTPRQLRLQRTEKQLTDFTVSPLVAQRQALAPVFEGFQIQREVLNTAGPGSQRQSLQRQIEGRQASLGAGQLQAGQYEAAVQRQANLQTPIAPLTQRPSTPAQWSQGGLWEAQRVADPGKPGQTISLREQEQSQHLGLLRTVGTQLGQGFRSDTGPAVQRYVEYGEALAPFQRMGTGTGRAVVTTALMQVPASQRSALQRAIDETVQRQQAQETQDRAIIGLHSLQRQLEHLDGQSEQPLMERIQARRGAGNPLPTALRRALELELNYDLGRVRLHDDAEADHLSKKVNAVAFTTGQDIFFRAGTFNPNTRTGVELIAHEVKHTKQQAQGMAKPGIDGDAGQEHDARNFGSQFAGKVNLDALAGLEHKATPQNKQGHALPVPPQLAGNLRAGSVQRSTSPSKPTLKTSPVNRTGGVIDVGGMNLRDQPNAKGKVVANLKAGTTFTVQEEVEGGWYKVALGTGHGYAASHLVRLAPDRGAVLHQISAGQPAIGIAQRYYSGAVKPGEDLRFYVNVLHHVNPDAIPNPGGEHWKDAKTLKDFWVWVPSVAFAQTLRGVVKSGSFSGGAYDAVKSSAAAVVKATIGQLPGGKDVLDTLQSIGASGEKVLNNPGAFVSNFGRAVSGGFRAFTENLPQHLQTSVVGLFTGTMGDISLPKTWDATGILHVGLQTIGYAPDQVQARLVAAVPGGMAAINAAGEAKDALTEIQKNGFAVTVKKHYEDGAALQETVLGGVKSYVLNTVITQGIKTLATLFIPGAGIIQAAVKLYETVRFIWDKIKDLTRTFQAIMGSLAAIAAGNIGEAVAKISSSLVGMLGLGVGFLARIAHLDGIAAKVKSLFDRIRAPIEKAIQRVFAWFRGLVKRKGAKPNAGSEPAATPGTTKTLAQLLKGKLFSPLQFIGKWNKQTYRVWIEVDGGKPQFMLNPTASEAHVKLADYSSKMKAQKLEATMESYIKLGVATVDGGVAALQKELVKKGDDPNKAHAINLGKQYAAKLKGVYETLANALDAKDTYPFVTDADGKKRTQPVAISFDVDSKRFDTAEYQRQVSRQQVGLNALELPQWATNRASYIETGRDDAGSTSQDRFRLSAKTSMRDTIRDKIITKVNKSTGKLYTIDEAEANANRIVAWYMKNKAVLHEPDQIAGGNPIITFDPANIDWSLLGIAKVNGSIGSNWKTKVLQLDKEVAKVPAGLRKNVFMNASLTTKVR